MGTFHETTQLSPVQENRQRSQVLVVLRYSNNEGIPLRLFWTCSFNNLLNTDRQNTSSLGSLRRCKQKSFKTQILVAASLESLGAFRSCSAYLTRTAVSERRETEDEMQTVSWHCQSGHSVLTVQLFIIPARAAPL